MMSEKRFELVNGIITDMQDNERMYGIFELVDKLNEQQSTNSALRTENNHLIDVIKEYAKKYEEQQATIKKLQDLCGKSDGENAKLRIENKQLRKELNDCEKFRYTIFKRMGELNDE